MLKVRLTHLDCSVGSGARGEAGNAVGEHGVGGEANQTLQRAACVRYTIIGAGRHAQAMCTLVWFHAGMKLQRPLLIQPTPYYCRQARACTSSSNRHTDSARWARGCKIGWA